MPYDPEPRLRALEKIFRGSHRRSVPIRETFLQLRGDPPQPGPLGTLASRRYEQALDLYLLIHAATATTPHEVTLGEPWWSLLTRREEQSLSASRKAFHRAIGLLAEMRLIVTTPSDRGMVARLLDESGDGAPYTRPRTADQRWIQLPHDYWRDGFDRRLSLAGKTALLISLSRDPAFFTLPLTTAPEWYGISKDTLRRGTDALVPEGLANYLTETVPARTERGTTHRRSFWLTGKATLLGRPTVFIAWAHTTGDWEGTLRAFYKLLRRRHINADIDLHHTHDSGPDWNRYGPTQIRNSDLVIIAVSSAWRKRWDGENDPREGAGAVAEADELMGIFNRNQQAFREKVRIAVLPGAGLDDVPNRLMGIQRFQIDGIRSKDKGFEDLVQNVRRRRSKSPGRDQPNAPASGARTPSRGRKTG